ncbi:MAG: hypothetical protein AAF399_14685 [Bacteroidota bacterium]
MNFVKSWFDGIIYPFREKDWLQKMWLIPVVGYFLTPFIQLLVLRGWRVELVRKIGIRSKDLLPKADVVPILNYFFHGIKLWLITGIYIIIPIIFFRILGISPFRTIIVEVGELLGNVWDNDTGLPLTTLAVETFWNITKELLIRNSWLIIYYPYYRTATIRYSLIGKFRKAHLAVFPNLRFAVRNVGAFLWMMLNQIIDKTLIFFTNIFLNIILTPIVGIALAPILFFYADFWTSGYEYGEIAKKMVDQEYPHLLSTSQESLEPEEPETGEKPIGPGKQTVSEVIEEPEELEDIDLEPGMLD